MEDQHEEAGLVFQQQHVPHDSAMSVASSKEEDVERIRELEDEVRMLAERANTASQRYADYENEIRVLEAKLRQEQRKNTAAAPMNDLLATTPGTTQPTVAAPIAQRPGISRFNSFMSTRKASPSPLNGGTPSPSAAPTTTTERQKELEEQLVKEQTARIAAEKKARQVSAEIEDLSATLFEQANEMVASERKENSVLKQRVELLERMQTENEAHTTSSNVAAARAASPVSPPRSSGSGSGASAQAVADAVALQKENAKLREKVRALEARDAQRVKRLERLEAANRRIERVRAMLKPP